MSLTTVINYDTPANFSYDTSKAEITTVAALKLVDDALTFSEAFANDTGFTYNATKTEFAAGLMHTKSVLGSAFHLGNDFGQLDLVFHTLGGSLTHTLNGVPTLVAGKLQCFGTQGIYYSHTTKPIESHKFKYTPNYTGSPASIYNILTEWNGVDLNDHFRLIHTGTGTIRIQLYNDVGTQIQALTSMGAAFSPTSGTEYEIELVIDSTLGTLRLFIDGTLHGTLTPTAWSRGSISTRLYYGACDLVYDDANASYDDVMVFIDAQHTTSYVAGYTFPANVYDEDIVVIPQNSHGVGSITSLDGMTATLTGTYRFAISIDSGAYQTWNGAAWVAWDNTHANASTLAQMDTNLPTLALTSNNDVDIKIINEIGNDHSTIDQLDIQYTGPDYETTGIPITVSSGILMDGLDDIVAVLTEPANSHVQLIIKINGTDYYYSGGWVVSDGTYAQSNTIADILTNKATLPVSSGATVRFVAHLKSDTGQETPTLTSLTVDYDFFYECATTLKCIVYGCVKDNSGNPVVGATISVDGDDYYYDSTLIAVQVSTTTDAMGMWELELVETNTTGNSVNFNIQYDNDGETVTKIEKGVEIPNQATAKLSDLV